MTKILVVSTYPIKNGQHGGQRRVAAIVEAYRRAGFEVRFVAVFAPDHYKYYSRYDIPLKGAARRQSLTSPFTSDVLSGQAIYEDASVRKKFAQVLQSFRPNIIQIEQVFPYLGIKPLLKELGLKPKLILSSHNIEYSHKQQILESSGYAHQAAQMTELIRTCEADLARTADLVISVSREDAAELEALGARHIIIATNGIAQFPLTETAQQYWAQYKVQNMIRHIATFVGSAHPPNWHGFLKMVGDRMGFLPTDTALVLAGSISDYFQHTFKDLRPEHATFWQRVLPAGRLSDALLTGLIDASDVLLLPITEGGGSNLKTAEAILSAKKIVATSYAFRAFEQYLTYPNISIADTPKEFRASILSAFESPYIERTHTQQKLAEQVQWQYCLKPMVQGVQAL